MTVESTGEIIQMIQMHSLKHLKTIIIDQQTSKLLEVDNSWINLGSKARPFNSSGHVPWHARLPSSKLQFEFWRGEGKPSTLLNYLSATRIPIIFPFVIRTNNFWATLFAEKTWRATEWIYSFQHLPTPSGLRWEILYGPPLCPCKACTHRCHCWALQLRTSRTSPSFKLCASTRRYSKWEKQMALLSKHIQTGPSSWDVIRREICRVGFDPRNPKPETDSEDLTSPGPLETRNPKPTFKTWLPEDRPKPETDY